MRQGTVYFHLAEQKNNDTYPFAFLATYAFAANPQAHIPPGRILQQSMAQRQNALLLEVLEPIRQAASQSSFLTQIVDGGMLYQPTLWTAAQAYAFLQDIPCYETAGIAVRVPNWWTPKQTPRPTVQVKLNPKNEALAGLDALLDFNVNVVLPDGHQLTSEECAELLGNQSKLIRIRGQWLELDRDQLQEVLVHWLQQKRSGLSIAESLRLLAGVQAAAPESEEGAAISRWTTVLESAQLHEILERLRTPAQQLESSLQKILHARLHAKLRPYQEQGVAWLWLLYHLRLGGCLADDMGLGKTIQVISLLLLIQHQFPHRTHLLVVPASLVGNWRSELARFAPTIRYLIVHGSERKIDPTQPPDITEIDLVITTYGLMTRLPFFTAISWDLVIIDEAQALKNPHARQTRALKDLRGRIKLALTGTPIENSLVDLWSLFDCIAPALLGGRQKFIKLCTTDDEEHRTHLYAVLKRLISPYILRRLKSDKRIIADLPDKTEMITYCTLTIHQATLYQQSVDELRTVLEGPLEAMQRRGLVLAYLMRLKQICNHPNQWLGHQLYTDEASGKFVRLRELCQAIAEKQEKAIIFTQFRELVPALAQLVSPIFGRTGLQLHGDTPVQQRTEMVAEFQRPDGPPFLVLSLKAGGTGLTLTQAAHVIHFDRWWNPAVENQATDRAYRIGQKSNVLVHKFVCSGTIEEKIDMIIAQKSTMAQAIVGQSDEVPLVELSNDELLAMVSLDFERAVASGEAKEEEL